MLAVHSIVKTEIVSERSKVGHLYREARKQHGMTQFQVAQRAGFKTHDLISRIETGRYLPSTELARRIGEILLIDKSTLFIHLLAARREEIAKKLGIGQAPFSIHTTGQERFKNVRVE